MKNQTTELTTRQECESKPENTIDCTKREASDSENV